MIQKDTPINFDIVREKINESGLEQIGNATIREIVRLVNNIEKASGEKFIRMEMGVPGIDPPGMEPEVKLKLFKKGWPLNIP